MKIKKKYQGKAPYRYTDNPMEQRFALAWQEENDRPNGGAGVLEYMMGDGSRAVDVSDRDRLVANSIIQWLGSPVGQLFLARVLLSPGMRDERVMRDICDVLKIKKERQPVSTFP